MQKLNLDKSSYYLVMLIAIFAQNSNLSQNGYVKVKKIQEYVRFMLYRYLCTKLSLSKAQRTVEMVELLMNLFITFKASLLNSFINPK